MNQTVVLYPGALVGHVGPMTKLAGAFLKHGYDVTVVLVGYGTTATDRTAIEGIVASNPSISFHVLRPPPAPPATSSDSKHPLLVLLDLLRRCNEPLGAFLGSIPRQRLHSVVIDMFCVDAIDVVAAAGVPVYTFFASCASCLSALTQFPALVAGRQTGLKDLGDTPLDLLGVPPMPASHFTEVMLEHPEGEVCKAITEIWRRNTETMGVLVSTFEQLESRAVRSLRDPGRNMPAVYCVGPLLAGAGNDKGKDGVDECLAWLDAQPDGSVVFLCFGSMGVLSAKQLKEMAVGLERSGHRFLWCVRVPAAAAGHVDEHSEQEQEPELDAVLPEGFLERTKNKGMVVKSWAPQVEVLRHRATGAFVTHCGWNSVLESVAAGVPMLCWPLYAEQKMNKVWMTAGDGMGVALELEGYRDGFVGAEEVEAKVRLVMTTEGEEGVVQLRARAARLRGLRDEAEAALADGGSSRVDFLRFLLDVKNLEVGGRGAAHPVNNLQILNAEAP